MKQGRNRRRSNLYLIGCGLIFIGVVLIIINFFSTYKPGKLIINGPFNLGAYEFDRATLSGKETDIAWKLYVQLATRKAAIPIEDNDIITEVYDSWYQLFTTTREYLIELPSSDLEGNENAQEIVKLSLEVLNEGLRPHLTTWQGKYRKWYEAELNKKENENLTPQEIQRKYPEYQEIIEDMKNVNKELIKYAEELKRFSHEKPPSFSTKTITWFKELYKSN